MTMLPILILPAYPSASHKLSAWGYHDLHPAVTILIDRDCHTYFGVVAEDPLSDLLHGMCDLIHRDIFDHLTPGFYGDWI